jgi:hypothetical protein
MFGWFSKHIAQRRARQAFLAGRIVFLQLNFMTAACL